MKFDSTKRTWMGGIWAAVVIWVSACVHESQAQRRNSYWLCPQVRCRDLTTSCINSEYIVFEYSYRSRGRLINVRCESCPYCTDAPWQTGRRRRHAQLDGPVADQAMERPGSVLYSLLAARPNHSQCPDFNCPPATENCIDTRATDVILSGRQCGACPACYDNVYDKEEVIST